MRIGLLINLAPRKLDSLEGWLLKLAEEAVRRGHTMDIFGRLPIHPELKAAFDKLGVGYGTTDALEADSVEAVRTLAGYDVLFVNMFQPRMRPALLAYAAWPAHVVMVDHTSGRAPEEIPGIAKSVMTRALDRVSLARVDGLVGVSEYVRRRDLERFGLPEERVKTIYNGVDVSRFNPEKPKKAPGEPVNVTVVAHLTREKGVHVFLSAISIMREKNVNVTIVGDGHMEGELKKLARDLGLDPEKIFKGLRDDVPELLSAADILVHPAVWEEAFGLTITEGMASGCATVASRVGGIPEIIEDGKSGRLVRPGDPEELAAVLDALCRSPETRARLGAAARARVCEKFSLDRCVSEHLDYLQDVVMGRLPVYRRNTTQRPSAASGKNTLAPAPNLFGDEGDAQDGRAT